MLVRQLSGSGDVVVPKNVDASVMDAFRVAVFWARLNEAGEACTTITESVTMDFVQGYNLWWWICRRSDP